MAYKRSYTTYTTASAPYTRGRDLPMRRPFKRVRVQGNRLVPVAPTTIANNPYFNTTRMGARGIKKGVDTNINQLDIVSDFSNNAFILPLNLIQAGTGSWNRVGRNVTMNSIRVRGTIELNMNDPTDNNEGRLFRMLIVYDKQPNGVLPVKSDIIQYKDQTGVEQGFNQGFLAYDNMERFVILKDTQCAINFGSNINAGTVLNLKRKVVDEYVKIGLTTNFKAEASPSTIADISTGALYLMFLTDATATSAARPSLNFRGATRLRYVDQ